MLPGRQGSERANFVVAVRCRRLDAREEVAASPRLVRRGSGRQSCILLNCPAPPSTVPAATVRPVERGESQASVVLVDPYARGDATALWRSCAASPEGSSLQLQLDVEGLRRALSGQDGVRCFNFDAVFPPSATNEEIYAALVQRLVIDAENGYNGTVFAYGQTGTGKSHTVFGEKGEGVPGLCTLVAADLFGQRSRPTWLPGTGVPACVVRGPPQQEMVQRSMIFVSFMELYNERLRDLLVDPATVAAAESVQGWMKGMRCGRPSSCRYDDLEVVEHPLHGVQVPHATRVRVHCVAELEQLLEEGGGRRTKAATATNKASSRSHAIVQFTVRRCIGDVLEAADAGGGRHVEADRREAQVLCSFLTAKLWMVDLAGSERVSGFASLTAAAPAGRSGAHGIGGVPCQLDGRRREGANINRSLLALGNCIKALGTACRQQRRRGAVFGGDAASYASHLRRQQTVFTRSKTSPWEVHVPYRDSKLTRLLKESLGGNTRTVMLATVSPSCTCFEETFSTLRYAARARSITRQVRQNFVVAAADSEDEADAEGNVEAVPTTAHGGDCGASSDRDRAWVAERQANHRLRLLELEAEVRSLRTQLHVAEAATEKMGLPRSGDDLTGVSPAVSATASTVSSDSGTSEGIDVDRCWAIYNQTRRELQALLQERAAASARREDVAGGPRILGNKEPIRELLRQERQNALLQERQRRIDAFLL
ncbi:putative kinesin-like protein [Trypanosoma rangeli]|uniref:Kinesin-like protein n=1 Tax=Trypanosoma rangeli TaxID=5698 RepID=A0A3R7MDH9_TRYRA|nr:putative kinesin-like protein [Trypanosoma rangeli]RNF03811.1 putative kinesin-like protein [Trypanosoma rangeli]|eukprot:RNF03811.1 putative kinesin-like protein [Trypanosoma rangeli]